MTTIGSEAQRLQMVIGLSETIVSVRIAAAESRGCTVSRSEVVLGSQLCVGFTTAGLGNLVVSATLEVVFSLCDWKILRFNSVKLDDSRELDKEATSFLEGLRLIDIAVTDDGSLEVELTEGHKILGQPPKPFSSGWWGVFRGKTWSICSSDEEGAHQFRLEYVARK